MLAVTLCCRWKEWIGDINAGNISSSRGNHIKASAAYMVFNIDSGGRCNCCVFINCTLSGI